MADYKKIQALDHSIDVHDKLNSAFKLARKYEKKDYYKTLGLQKNATKEEIRKAYKKEVTQNSITGEKKKLDK